MSFHEAMAHMRSIVDDISFDLSDENIDASLEKGDHFVYFYHPECTKCQIFGPQWKFFARDEQNREEKSDVTIAKMNLLQNIETARRLRIISFPTLLYFSDGYYYNYTRGQSQTEFEEFIENKNLEGLTKKRIPDAMTWYRDWYLYLRWWAINGPGLYPMEAGATGAAATAFVLLCIYCCCCGCSKKGAKASAEEGKKSEGSPGKPKRE